MMNVEPLLYWIKERQKIYELKEQEVAKPWTEDSILRNFRFCNVYREQDSVTKWIAENWRETNCDDPDLWYSMVVARLANWPETLAVLGYAPSPTRFAEVLTNRAAQGEKVFSSAYIVSTNGNSMPKPEYLAQKVLTPLWNSRKEIRPMAGDTLSSFATRLNRYNGLGTFMVGQVIADTKYATKALTTADDWWTWAFSGPGSRRGLNRIMQRPKDSPWKEKEWHEALLRVRDTVNFSLNGELPELHAQDMQNCLCETDKYLRTKNGEGRPRNNYPGAV